MPCLFQELEMRIPVKLRRPGKTALAVLVAFIAGILLSGFLLGQLLYTPMIRRPSVYQRLGKSAEGAPIPPSTPAPPTGPQAEQLSILETANRMVIYTAYLTLEVDSVDAAIAQIMQTASAVGGYVAGMDIYTRDSTKAGYITIKVPQKSFYQVLDQLKQLGEVKGETINTEDVTEQYIDLQARLNNLQKQEQRLLEILEMAETVDEVLAVEKELERVRGEIESLTGQLQYIERRVDYSTITINLVERTEEPWIHIPSVDWSKPIEAGLWDLSLVAQLIISASIVLAPLAAVGFAGYKVYRSSRRRSGEAE